MNTRILRWTALASAFLVLWTGIGTDARATSPERRRHPSPQVDLKAVLDMTAPVGATSADGTRQMAAWIDGAMRVRVAFRQAGRWQPARPVYQLQGSYQYVSMTAALSEDGRSAVVAWLENIGGVTQSYRVGASVWNGRSWSAPTVLETIPWKMHGSLRASISASGSQASVLWPGGQSSWDFPDLRVATWTGQAWQTPVSVGWGPGPGGSMDETNYSCDLAANGQLVQCISSRDIYIGPVTTCVWTPAGWSAATELGQASAFSSPVIDLSPDGSFAAAIWSDANSTLVSTILRGGAWSTPNPVPVPASTRTWTVAISPNGSRQVTGVTAGDSYDYRPSTVQGVDGTWGKVTSIRAKDIRFTDALSVDVSDTGTSIAAWVTGDHHGYARVGR